MPIQQMSFVAFFTDKKKEDTMGKRTRDEVIYSRVDYHVKQEFESQMNLTTPKNFVQSRPCGLVFIRIFVYNVLC